MLFCFERLLQFTDAGFYLRKELFWWKSFQLFYGRAPLDNTWIAASLTVFAPRNDEAIHNMPRHCEERSDEAIYISTYKINIKTSPGK